MKVSSAALSCSPLVRPRAAACVSRPVCVVKVSVDSLQAQRLDFPSVLEGKGHPGHRFIEQTHEGTAPRDRLLLEQLFLGLTQEVRPPARFCSRKWRKRANSGAVMSRCAGASAS